MSDNKKLIKLAKSDFIEKFLYLDGQPTSLNDYPHMRTIINTKPNRSVVLKFGRQCIKSTTMANIMVANAVLMPKDPTAKFPVPGGFKQMYVAPTAEQSKIFSQDRLNPPFESPFIKKYYSLPKLTQNVFTKQFANQSKFYIRYALRDADRLRGYSADCLCYDKNTEVLTNSGWKLFKDLDKTELIATYNSTTNKVEYQKPSEYFTEKYTGKLVEYKHQGFRLAVTPGHKMFVSQELNTGYYKNPKKKGWFDVEAKNTLKMNFKVGVIGEWPDKSKDEFIIPSYYTYKKPDGTIYKDGKGRFISEFKVPMQEFMVFMGWWLSEGSVNKKTNSIVLSQNEGECAEEIRKSLNDINVHYAEYKSNNCISFAFTNRALADYLKILGTSYTKYIPPDLLNQKKYLLYLLDTLYKGDGMHRVCHNTEDTLTWGELKTASLKLADSVQEAWIRLGRTATIRKVKNNNRIGQEYHYVVRPMFRNYIIFWNCSTNASKINEVEYDDTIYCLTVPNHKIFVRDNIEKKVVISGQSFDEAQDLVRDIVPIANQAMSRSHYKWNYFAGTPKRTKGTLAYYWFKSTMNEWIVKCSFCDKHNFLDEKNIGKETLICRYCGKPINPINGQWFRTNTPDEDDYYEGFRVSQIQFCGAPWVNWKKDIVAKYENDPRNVFFNEVLGLEYDEGISPITREEIKRCCTGEPIHEKPTKLDLRYPTYIGLDYGPISSKHSFTLLTIIQKQVDNKIKLLYAKRYMGKEANYSFIHDDVARLKKLWGAKLIGADYGLGEASNSEIRKRVGDDRLIAFFHQGQQKDRIRWNARMCAYTTSRNRVITDMFQSIKQGKWIFPKYNSFKTFMEDLLAVAIDVDEDKGTFKYVNNDPDDTLHSLIYGSLVLELGELTY